MANPHPVDESQLDDLLAEYHQAKAEGRAVALADLCAAHPDLADALQAELAEDEDVARRLGGVFGTHPSRQETGGVGACGAEGRVNHR